MIVWEYLSGSYWWDAKRKKYLHSIGGTTQEVSTSQTQEVSSFDNFLNQFGAQGWELVSMNADRMYATHNAWETNTSVTTYWAIFKRPKV